jgi:antitoxin PrlF
MSVAIVTSKGQTTIPKKIRDGLGLKPKDQLHFTLLPDGTVIMRAKMRRIAELYGALHKRGRKPLSVADVSVEGARARRQRPAVEEPPDGVLLKAKPAFTPTKPKDVFGSLAYKGPAKSVAEMERGIAAEAKRPAKAANGLGRLKAKAP